MRLQRWGHPTRRAAQKAPGNDGRAPRTPHLPRLLFKSVLFPDGNEPGDGALPIKKRLHSHANPLVQCLKSARRGRQSFSRNRSCAGYTVARFVTGQSPSDAGLFATPRTPARRASLSLTVCRSLPKFTSIESVTPPTQPSQPQ